MQKHKLMYFLIGSILVNYLGWVCLVVPARNARNANRFREEIQQLSKDKGQATQIVGPKPRKLRSLAALYAVEWSAKLGVFALAPGVFIYQFIRRKMYRDIPDGLSIAVCLCLGLVSDILSLWWIAPASLFYAGAIWQLGRSKINSFPANDPRRKGILRQRQARGTGKH